MAVGGGVGADERSPEWEIHKRHRDWMVIDPHGQLVCLTMYRRGAEEVVRRLAA